MDFLTVNEVATMLNVNEQTIRNYINKKDLKAYKIGGSYQIDKSDLRAFIETTANTYEPNQKQ